MHVASLLTCAQTWNATIYTNIVSLHKNRLASMYYTVLKNATEHKKPKVPSIQKVVPRSGETKYYENATLQGKSTAYCQRTPGAQKKDALHFNETIWLTWQPQYTKQIDDV